ncbi:PTS system fructose-specific transporter subunits IIBC [Pseudomonas putida S11]|nr:PTS system fructose-specific transporter subunits IIBC [Pseudomonas putida S11]
MNIAIVTACPNGQVSSVLSARLLSAAAQRRGWSTSVEVQDAGHPERQLSATQIAEADWVLVVSTGPVDLERFVGKRVYQSTPSQALADREGFLDEAASSARLLATVPGLPAETGSAGARIVAVTACPTGVAHTFMAAEALQQAAQQLGYELTVETQGSVGARNPLSAEAIAAADVVLLAADIEVPTAHFAGKRIYRCGTGIALKQARATLDKALADAKVENSGDAAAASTPAKGEKSGVYKHLLTGVSFMLPMVVAGGLLIALSFVFGIEAYKEAGTLPAALMQIGGEAAFKLMVPLLAGYIAWSIADRPGLAPGMIGGLLASTLGAGFIRGYRRRLPRWLQRQGHCPLGAPAQQPGGTEADPDHPAAGQPVHRPGDDLRGWPASGGDAGRAHAISRQHGHHQCHPVGSVAGRHDVRRPGRADQQGRVCLLGGAAGLVELCADGGDHGRRHGAGQLAWVSPASWPDASLPRASVKRARRRWRWGCASSSEGAIPFAAKDPLRVIPASVAGGALTGALSMYFGCKLMAPHGGLFVLLIPNAINHALLYLLAIVAGSLLTAVVYAVIKKSERVELAVASVKG